MIEISHLVKKYGNHLAVDDVTMKFEEGKVYGLLGPNGAGKSTILNIITGYLGATSGAVTIQGHDIRRKPEKAKACIGYLPETPPLYQEMTVWEYINFAAELKHLERGSRKEQVKQVITRTKLAEEASRLIRNLSKGGRQRVGLAQAILGSPAHVILDEPTAGLDPKQILGMRELIRELGQEHTVILSSHILQEVSAVCDKVYILTGGKVAAFGTPRELESQMAGKQELCLSVKGGRERLHEILNKQEGIAWYGLGEGEELGTQSLYIVARGGLDLRESLFYLLANENYPIMHMETAGKSLEDVYLKLTAEVEVQDAGNF